MRVLGRGPVAPPRVAVAPVAEQEPAGALGHAHLGLPHELAVGVVGDAVGRPIEAVFMIADARAEADGGGAEKIRL